MASKVLFALCGCQGVAIWFLRCGCWCNFMWFLGHCHFIIRMLFLFVKVTKMI